MYFYLSSMILSQNFIQNYSKIFPKFKYLQSVFLFQAGPADRTGRPDPVSRTCTLVHVCRSADRSTDQKRLLSVFCQSANRSTAYTKLCFIFWGRSTDRSTKTLRLFANGSFGRPAGRPIDCQEPQRLFPLWWFSEKLFLLLFVWQSFLIFWGLILDHINLIKSCFNPLLSL